MQKLNPSVETIAGANYVTVKVKNPTNKEHLALCENLSEIATNGECTFDEDIKSGIMSYKYESQSYSLNWEVPYQKAQMALKESGVPEDKIV